MKKAIYILYITCVVSTIILFLYVCTNFRNEIYQTRETDGYQRLTNYDRKEVRDKKNDTVPLGIKTEYVIQKPDIPKEGASLIFYTIHQNVSVYVGEELTYKLVPSEKNSFGKTPGSTWNKVFIYPEDREKEIRVILIPVYESSIDLIPDFYLGSEVNIWMSIIKHDILPCILSLVAVICGIGFIVFETATYHNTKVDNSLLMMGMFSVNIGLWKMTDIPGIALFIPHSIALSYVPFLTLLLLVVPFVVYVKNLFNVNSKVWYISCLMSIAVIILTIVLQVNDIRDMRQTLWMNHLVMGISLMIAVGMLIRELRWAGWNSRLKIMMICMGSCFLGMLVDLFIYYISGGASMTVLGMLGFLVYIIVLGVLSVRQARNLMHIGIQAKHFEQMAYHDQLTGLYNRAAYADYTGQPDFKCTDCTLVMCDLNNLKDCNDTWGHDKGDFYISSSAQIIQKVFEGIGKCYRVGGDEFCVLMRNVSQRKCRQLIAKMKEEAEAWNRNSKENFEIKIACGYACYDDKLDYDLGDTLRRADRMMYHEKFIMKHGNQKET